MCHFGEERRVPQTRAVEKSHVSWEELCSSSLDRVWITGKKAQILKDQAACRGNGDGSTGKERIGIGATFLSSPSTECWQEWGFKNQTDLRHEKSEKLSGAEKADLPIGREPAQPNLIAKMPRSKTLDP